MNRLIALSVLLGACASKSPATAVKNVAEAAPSTSVSSPDVDKAMPGAEMPKVETPDTPTAKMPDMPKAEMPGVEVPKVELNGCSQEIALTCDEGFVDGCGLKNAVGGTLTFDHVCVAADTKPGPPCIQEIAAACDEGFKDACMTTPPLSLGHICVQSQ